MALHEDFGQFDSSFEWPSAVFMNHARKLIALEPARIVEPDPQPFRINAESPFRSKNINQITPAKIFLLSIAEQPRLFSHQA